MKKPRRLRRLGIVLGVLVALAGTVWFLLPGEPPVERGSWLDISLGGELADRDDPGLLDAPSLSLLELRAALKRATYDERISGVIFYIGPGSVTGGRCEELARMVAEFRRESQKPVLVHALSLDLASWVFSTYADEVVLHPAGRIDLRSPAMTIPFFGNAVRQLGLEPDLLRYGDQKGIFEQFSEAAPSEALARHFQELHTGLWSRVRGLAKREGISVKAIAAAAANGSFSSETSARGLWVDHVEDARTFLERHGEPTRIPVSVYRDVSDETAGLEPEPAIAILSIEGTIMPGESGSLPLVGRTQGLEDLRQAIAEIQADPEIRGVIVRIDSPGGEAFTSEEIYREIDRLRAELPVVALLGSQATSGGYYAALACREIYALPTTVTGSIGIVALRFAAAPALEKLGISPHVVVEEGLSTPSPVLPLDEAGREAATEALRDSYRLFVDRLQEGRTLDFPTALSLADGSVHLGVDAHRRGLVDGVGGWAQAWQRICEKAEIGDPALATAEVYPRPRSWWQRLQDAGEGDLPLATDHLRAWLGTGPSGTGFWALGPILGW